MHKILTQLAFISIFLLLLASCTPSGKKRDTSTSADMAILQQYILILRSFDTLQNKERLHIADSLVHHTDTSKNKVQLQAYNLAATSYYALKEEPDSVLLHGLRLKPDTSQSELKVLQDCFLLNQQVRKHNLADAALVTQVLDATRHAEQTHSMFTYRLYDLLANTYYINHNAAKSLEYTKLYYDHHPFASHPVIRQRYYDISFLLAARLDSVKQMQDYLQQARQFAISIRDSVALARTYDQEAQLYSMLNQTQKSLVASQQFFRYMKEHNMVNQIVYNNLATSFCHNHQPDSAIYYYNQAIYHAQEKDSTPNLFTEYNGLAEAYVMKGDYKQALVTLDSAYTISMRNKMAIQAEKIEEIHTQYETEKKDNAISQLKTTNTLNQKIIMQQRAIFIIIALALLVVALFIYYAYRQKLAKALNKQLLSENQRYALEQKVQQMQLDPHFIYNAIANLQGLISSDKKEEANAYLLAFSKLMRNILELNRHEFISLDDEINALKNYLSLQQMRHADNFSYKIDTGGLDTEDLLIPPMLVQPFVENAIEHGFTSTDVKGELQLQFAQQEKQLIITIDDNGKSLPSADIAPRKKQSLSGIIIQERLDILFNKQKKQAHFTAQHKSTDMGNGYIVTISLPLLTA